MDSKEVYQKWTPIDNLKRAYDVDGIYWDSSAVISYHVTDETYRSDCWQLDFVNNGRFYICKGSQYIERFREKSPLFPDNAIHFVLVGTNTIVDILAKDYPVIRLSE